MTDTVNPTRSKDNIGQGCCLVVEDNTFAGDIICTFLRQRGFEVSFAGNGKQALALYLERPGRFDIIFMDLQMPVMSGYCATECIRSSGHEDAGSIPIVAMSGEPLGGDMEARGFTHCLLKPFRMQDLLPILAQLNR